MSARVPQVAVKTVSRDHFCCCLGDRSYRSAAVISTAMRSESSRWTRERVIPLAFAVTVGGLAIVLAAILIGSIWKWNHDPQSSLTIPPQDQTSIATTTSDASAPSSRLPTLTATSIPESDVGEVGSSTPPSSSSSSSAFPPARQVAYRVIAEIPASIRYTSATGNTFTYQMQAGRWQIIAPDGGRIVARPVQGKGAVRCETARAPSGPILTEDSTFAGDVSCGTA